MTDELRQMPQCDLYLERVERVRRAAINYRNGSIEVSRYPHGKALTNFKADEKRWKDALWAAREEIDLLLRSIDDEDLEELFQPDRPCAPLIGGDA